MTNKNYPFFRKLVTEVITNNNDINVIDDILSKPENIEYIQKNCMRKGAVDVTGIANCICNVEDKCGKKFTVDEVFALANKIFPRVYSHIVAIKAHLPGQNVRIISL